MGFEFCDLLVRQASGFGDAVFGGAGERNFYCVLQCALMPDRHEQGFDPCSRPQHRPDHLLGVHQGRMAALLLCRRVVCPSQPALGAADGRPVQKKGHVRRQPQPPRVCDALPVDKETIRRSPEFRRRCKTHRRLTKRQQPGYIGKDCIPGRRYNLHYLQSRILKNHDCRADSLFVAAEGTIHAGYRPRGAS